MIILKGNALRYVKRFIKKVYVYNTHTHTLNATCNHFYTYNTYKLESTRYTRISFHVIEALQNRMYLKKIKFVKYPYVNDGTACVPLFGSVLITITCDLDKYTICINFSRRRISPYDTFAFYSFQRCTG